MKCFWCQTFVKSRELTKDHLLPKFAGGMDEKTNIVDSCSRCNESRGQITYYSERILQLMKMDTSVNAVRRSMKRLLRKEDVIVALRRNWAALELERLGVQPSAYIELKFDELRAKLMEALSNV